MKAFWDTGKVSREGELVLCETDELRLPRPAGARTALHKSYFESGAPETEMMYPHGQASGARARPGGRTAGPAASRTYVDDRAPRPSAGTRTASSRSDEEYEADGSRRLTR